MRRSYSLRKEVRESTDGFLKGTPLSSTSALCASLWDESGEAELHCNECQLDPPDSGGGKRVCHQLHSLLQGGGGGREEAYCGARGIVPGGEQSSVVIGGLDPGSSYLVSVSASTSAGTGVMSEPVVLVKLDEPTEPTEPVEVPVTCTCTTTETSDSLNVSNCMKMCLYFAFGAGG